MKNFSRLFKLSLLLCLSGTLTAQTSNWEITILRNMEEHRTDGKTSFYKGISASMYVICSATPAAYLISGLINHDKHLKKTALYLFESVAISQLISFPTKAIVSRDRPYVKDPTLTPVKFAKNSSFPSGHTSAAFSLATSLTIVNPKWYIVLPSFTWASLVGYSRLYLGVHYPTDAIAGAILGSGSAWLSYRLNKWMHHSKTNKLKALPGS